MPEIPRPDTRPPADVASVLAAARRSRWPRIVVTVVATVALAAAVDAARGEADAAQRAWGPADMVWVAARELEAGLLISDADVTRRTLPEIALPDDPVRDSPIGLRLRVPISPGEILRAARLADADTGRVGALLPAGTGGIQLPTGGGQLSPGEVVDLFALVSGERVARRAEVILVDDGLATVAVALDEIPSVVRSFTTGDVVPVVVP